MYTQIEEYISKIRSQPVEESRKPLLNALVNYIKEKNGKVNLNFICTHNSRRSHLGQIWAAVAAHYFEVEGVNTFSGGTEVTAFNPRAVAALKRAGFQITILQDDANPVYGVIYEEGADPFECFSKVYDNEVNPKENFAAVMTCSQAEAECPFIAGAEKRISLHYEDPKEADNTPQEAERYDERCLQIASEMFYVFRAMK